MKRREEGMIERISTAVADGCVCGLCGKVRELIVGSARTGEIANSTPAIDERAAFEKWWRSSELYAAHSENWGAWYAWQARASLEREK